jgi:hypothetical protein
MRNLSFETQFPCFEIGFELFKRRLTQVEGALLAVEFTKSWRVTKENALATPRDRYTSVHDFVESERFQIARWSRFHDELDRERAEQFLKVTAKDFGANLGWMLSHTISTGIGKIVTFRDAPRYVLAPGRDWRAFIAARFGISRTRYLEHVKWSRVGELLLEKNEEAANQKERSFQAQIAAFADTVRDIGIEHGALVNELSELRRRLARFGDEADAEAA